MRKLILSEQYSDTNNGGGGAGSWQLVQRTFWVIDKVDCFYTCLLCRKFVQHRM